MSAHDIRPTLRPVEPEVGAPSRALVPGTLVEGWLVMGVIREESDHVLYSVTLGPGGLPAALKLIDQTYLHDGRYYRLLRRAARRWKKTENPHLARLADAGKTPVGPYIATVPFAGPTLAAELERGHLPADRSGELALQLASALDAVLEAGLTPGAFAPRDIVLTEDGALITDPGVGGGVPRGLLLEAHEAIHYLSPEEAMGDAPMRQSCVYSLACILHHCLTGLPPYPRELPQAVLYAQMAEPPPRPSERMGSLPRALDLLFERAMAAEPEDRPATPGELAHDFAAALGLVQTTLVLPAVAESTGHSPQSTDHSPQATEPDESPDPSPQTPEPEPVAEEVFAAEELVFDAELVDEPAPSDEPKAVVSEPGPSIASRARRPVAVIAATAAFAAAGFAAGSAGGNEETETAKPRVAPGPPPAAVAAKEVAGELEGRRTRLRRRLAGAKSRAKQGAAARSLAGVHAAAARGAAGATPAGVRQALRDAGSGYSRMASAARRGSRQDWVAGQAAVSRADNHLARALMRASSPAG